MNDRAQIGCEEALRSLAAYLDHELEPAETAEVERHLETCRSCYSRADFERRLRERIRRHLEVASVPAAFEERMRGLLQKLTKES